MNFKINLRNIFLIVLTLSFLLGIYFFNVVLKGKQSETGIIFTGKCLAEVTDTRICKVEIIKKTENGAVARIQYHYLKGNEDVNRITVSAHQGKFDNIIGIQDIHRVKEGKHTIDVAFGLFKGGVFTQQEPYLCRFIFINIRGVDEKKNLYISPEPLELLIEYQQAWYGSRPDLRSLVENNQS